MDRHHYLDNRGSEEESHAAAATSASADGNKKACADCGTSKTPLWRSGPAGPKSLCNACGIRKKRRAIFGLEDKKVKRTSEGTDRHRSIELGESLKRNILAIGKHVAMPRSSVTRNRRNRRPCCSWPYLAAQSMAE